MYTLNSKVFVKIWAKLHTKKHIDIKNFKKEAIDIYEKYDLFLQGRLPKNDLQELVYAVENIRLHKNYRDLGDLKKSYEKINMDELKRY